MAYLNWMPWKRHTRSETIAGAQGLAEGFAIFGR
jgi:hypothetical protein